jgi:hypothetical protein
LSLTCEIIVVYWYRCCLLLSLFDNLFKLLLTDILTNGFVLYPGHVTDKKWVDRVQDSALCILLVLHQYKFEYVCSLQPFLVVFKHVAYAEFDRLN